MPPLNSRMTKNQDRTHRYRPGKAAVQEDSDEESSSEEEAPPEPVKPRARPAPAAQTYRPKLPPAAVARKPEIDLEGFVTASESSSDEEASGSGEEEESSEEESEESESEEEVKPRLIAPKFISKAARAKLQAAQPTKTEEDIAREEKERREEKATELLQAQIDRDQAAKAVGKKAWDDDDNALEDDVDDTDGLDPEAELAAWKIRELKRIKRDREALVEKEKIREENERRRNLTAEEREAEDQELREQQQADYDARGKMAFMQKYYHKGAFFQGDEQDEEVQAALSRNIAGATFVDESNKEILPEYMRIRDMTKLGKTSRTKYKDLRSEDTGRFGDFNDKRNGHQGLDDRFRPDSRTFDTQTGANTAPLGTRRPRIDEDTGRDEKRPRYT